MSMVHEVMAARHCGLRVAGIAKVTNLGTGLSPVLTTHEENLQFDEDSRNNLFKLVKTFLQYLK